MILDRGVVVTNHHVVEEASGVRVRQGRRQWPAKVLRTNRDHDLALLSVDGLGSSALPLRTSSGPKAGEPVWAVGAPHALELTLSEGIFSGLRPADAANLIQTTASISRGSSGGASPCRWSGGTDSNELVCTAREGIPRMPPASCAPRGPPGGWSRANWVIVGARGFRR